MKLEYTEWLGWKRTSTQMAENLDLPHWKPLGVTFSDLEVEVEAELLVDTLANTLTEVEAVTLGKELGKVKVVWLVDTRAKTLPVKKFEILGVSMALDVRGTSWQAGSVSSKKEVQDTQWNT